MTYKLELRSSHEFVYIVNVADVESIFYCKPTDPDILTVLMSDGKRLYCDEVCPVYSLQEEHVSEDLGKVGSLKSREYYPEKKTTNKTSKGVFDANMPRRKAYLRGFKDGAHAHKELIDNKPVSEDLEEAANNYSLHFLLTGKLYISGSESDAFKAGAQWQKEHLWKPADGDGLPIFDREVIVLTQPYPLEKSEYAVYFAHRPNPNGWDGKSVTTGKVEHYTPKTYDKGGWSIPNVVWWLDCDFPKKEEV